MKMNTKEAIKVMQFYKGKLYNKERASEQAKQNLHNFEDENDYCSEAGED